jgi:hypothetical protein
MIRRLRANLLDELQKQYVVTARAKGLPPRKVLFKYPLRMALNFFISDIGSILPHIISGTEITAVVLSLPTAGPMLLNALKSQDMYLAGSFLMFLALMIVIGVLVSDLALMALDPRIRLREAWRDECARPAAIPGVRSISSRRRRSTRRRPPGSPGAGTLLSRFAVDADGSSRHRVAVVSGIILLLMYASTLVRGAGPVQPAYAAYGLHLCAAAGVHWFHDGHFVGPLSTRSRSRSTWKRCGATTPRTGRSPTRCAFSVPGIRTSSGAWSKCRFTSSAPRKERRSSCSAPIGWAAMSCRAFSTVPGFR